MSAKDVTTPGRATAGGESDMFGAGAGAIVDSMAGVSVATVGAPTAQAGMSLNWWLSFHNWPSTRACGHFWMRVR